MTLNASELGRQLAARRLRTTYYCEVCAQPFVAWLREKQLPRTCSPKCRQSLWRQSQKTKTPAPGD